MNQPSERKSQWLLLLGVLLFLAGLLSGFTIPLMKNIELGLGAHMAGVTNGMFLMIAGLAWTRAELSGRHEKLAYVCAIYGTWANWFFVSLSAWWGTKALAPVHGKGHGTEPEEIIITLGLMSVSVTIIIATALLAWGFLRKLQY